MCVPASFNSSSVPFVSVNVVEAAAARVCDKSRLVVNRTPTTARYSTRDNDDSLSVTVADRRATLRHRRALSCVLASRCWRNNSWLLRQFFAVLSPRRVGTNPGRESPERRNGGDETSDAKRIRDRRVASAETGHRTSPVHDAHLSEDVYEEVRLQRS